MVGQFSPQVPAPDSTNKASEDLPQGLVHPTPWYLAALSEAFSYGYSEYNTEVSERSSNLYRVLADFPKRLPFDLIEAKGGMAGLVDKLFMRRDRLEHTAVLAVLKWVHRLAAVLPVDVLFDTLTGETGARAKTEVTAILAKLLSDYPDLAGEIKKIVADTHARSSAEGTTSAGAVINQFHGIKVPELEKTASSELAALKRSEKYWTGTDTTVAVLLAGLAGDLVIHIGHLIAEKAKVPEIKKAITSTVKAGKGAAFYIGTVSHAFYVNAQLQQIKDAGEKVDFVDTGDSRVCAVCIQCATGSPYDIENVPPIPQHGGCRCWYMPAGAII